MEPFLIILFAGFVALVVVAAIYSARAARKRREALAQMAARLGLEFRPDKDHALAEELRFLNRLAQGTNRYAFNVLCGKYRGHGITVFDYHYETHSTDSKGRRQTHHHYFSFFVLTLPRSFPELRIMKEGFMSKLAQAFGYDDVDFESAEFSREFLVRSADKRFAYDFCHSRMMEYLLANRDLSIEVDQDALAIGYARCLDAEQIELELERLLAIRSLMPEYLFNA